MKKGTVKFKGAADDKNTYLLATDGNIVRVFRNFKGDENKCDGVPSGWYKEQVWGLTSLCIDGGTYWYVYPTAEAWEELETFLK